MSPEQAEGRLGEALQRLKRLGGRNVKIQPAVSRQGRGAADVREGRWAGGQNLPEWLLRLFGR